MSNGFTSFDVEDEFEGGVFGADGEFYAKSQKERKKLSKDEQIYGIFFDGADSPKAKPKNAGFAGNTSFGAAPAAPKNYLNFVKSDKILYNPEAGKVKVNFGKKKKPATEATPMEAEEEEEPSKKKVKFNEARNTEMLFDKKKPASAVPDFIESDEEAQEEDNQINIKISKKLQDRKQKFDLKKHHQESDILGVPNEFGKRRKPAAATAAPAKSSKDDILEAEMEEKYGKGWKMMQMTGYKVNTGLGAREQGRVDPIKAVKKTVLDGSKVGDAFDHGKARGAADDLLNDLEDEEMQPRKADQPKMWKKGKAQEQQKYLRRTAHVRAHDITVPEKEILKPVLQQKLIDMRGAEAKYYEDYTAMKTIEQPRPATTTVSYTKPKFLSEMLLTVKGNVDKTKYNIQSFERKIKIEKDRVVNYNYEKKQRAEEQEKLDKNIQNLKVLSLKLQQFKTQADTFNADETIQLFNDCFTATPEQFVYLKLDSLFIVTVIKKVQAEVSGWKIRPDTLEANYGLYTRVKNFLIKILQYKEYLKYKSYTEKSVESIFKGTDNYDTTLLEKYLTELFNQTWTYPVKSYVINEWAPNKDLDTPLIPLFEKWKSILPPIVLTQMYDGVIMPKLQKSVDDWTPTSDPMPIHIWLHPWFPLLGQSRLETLWKSIQLKISQLLKTWQPHDKSALMLLKPWLKVFDQVSWENLIVRCILPKVLYALTDFEINPKKQEVGPVKWMLDWADYLPQDTLVQALENYVLRKIVEVGIQWINTPGSKKEEIKGWIAGWKEMLGQKIATMPAVNHYFRSLENIIR